MDTDDQDDLIHSLQEDARKQSELFQKAFAAVGGFAMVTSLLVYPFLCHDECSKRLASCWTHAIVSCGTHGLSIRLSRSMNYPRQHSDAEEDDYGPSPLFVAFWKTPLFAAAIALHILPLVLWVVGVFDQDVEHFHLGLVFGNVVTLLGSSILLWDVYSTRRALSELNGAKYEHKSL